MPLVDGDFWRICDISGRKVPASETVKQWDGLIVHRDYASPRHPQEFVRGVRDDQSVPDPRPRQPDTFIGPLTTAMAADASAGATSLEVESSVRFEAGDSVAVMLDNGDRALMQVLSVPDTEHITLTAGLPFSTSTGHAVINYTAVAPADLG